MQTQQPPESLVQQWGDALVTWATHNADDLTVGLVLIVATPLLGYIAKRASSLWRMLSRGKGDLLANWSPMMARYRARLSESTRSIHHAWMKEGQTLGDILVPVLVEDEGAGGIQDLSLVLARQLGQGAMRLAVIGEPGAGKSVALRLMAENAWRWNEQNPERAVIPVLMTFADFRSADFQLEKAAAEALARRDFHAPDGRDNGEVAIRAARELLPAGRLLILVDALDELPLAERQEAASRLTSELGVYAAAPAVFSCRVAAWTGQVQVAHTTLRMADFPPHAIRSFLENWRFEPPKSAIELLKVFDEHVHVLAMARNPLMLTIIAYLYSQPKYRMPENRSQFYEFCCRALLEEWDQAGNPNAANRFERVDKETVLSRLAYEHLKGPTPDRDFDEYWARERAALAMKEITLLETEARQLLDEVVERSGLLLSLPPRGLRFPHQTFLEFFAAKYLYDRRLKPQLLAHYQAEPQRWREPLLLYCGLSTDAADNAETVLGLLAQNDVEIVAAALCDVRSIEAAAAEQVVTRVESELDRLPTEKLLRDVGYLSANPHKAYADRVSRLLTKMLDRAARGEIGAELLQSLLVAALRRPTEETVQSVVDNAEHLNLRGLLPMLGENALMISIKVLGSPQLSELKKREWLEGLAQAHALDLLHSLAVSSTLNDALRARAGVLLLSLSGGPRFWELLKQGPPPPEVKAATKRAVSRWGWPWPPEGALERLALLRLIGVAIEASEFDPAAFHEHADPRVRYLVFALRQETSGDALTTPKASPSTLRAIWRWAPKPSRLVKWWLEDGVGSRLPAVVALFGGAIAGLWALASLIGSTLWDSALGLSTWIGTVLILSRLVALALVAALRKMEKVEKDDVVAVVVACTCVPFVILFAKITDKWGEGRVGRCLVGVLGLLWGAFQISLTWNAVPLTFLSIWLFESVFAFAALPLMESTSAHHPILSNDDTTKLVKTLRNAPLDRDATDTLPSA